VTFLITGATGNVGSLVVERLLEHGDRPRVFVRNARKALTLYADRVDVVVGDLTEMASLEAALTGVDAFLLINTGPDIAARDAAAAKTAMKAGVERLVKLSSMDSRLPVGTGVWHARGESAIRRSGITFTFVQPAGFMSNALGWAASIKTDGVVRAPTGEGRIAFVHPEDIAAVAFEALTTRRFNQESLPITGPRALSYSDMVATIGRAVGRSLEFHSISEEKARQSLLGNGDPEAVVDAHTSIWRAIREGRLATVTDNVERAVGRPAIGFDRWVEQNAGAFR